MTDVVSHAPDAAALSSNEMRTFSTISTSGLHNVSSFPVEASEKDVQHVRLLLSHCLTAIRSRFPNLDIDEEQLAHYLHSSPVYQSTAIRAHCLGEKVTHVGINSGHGAARPASSSGSKQAHVAASPTKDTIMDKHEQQQKKERLFRFWCDTGILDDIDSGVCRMKHDYFARQNRWAAPEADAGILALRCKAEMKYIDALSSITADMGLPLCARRSQAKQDKFLESWDLLKFSCEIFELGDEEMQPMLKGRDIFNLLCELREEVGTSTSSNTFRPLRMAKNLMSLTELRDLFYRLSPFYEHCSAKDLCSWHAYIDDNYCSVLSRRSTQAARLLQLKDLERARRHLQHGAVTDQRAQLWSFVLNEPQVFDQKIWSKRGNSRRYQVLIDDVCKWELLLDHVMLRCVQTTVNNDLQYFIFEDIAYQVILLFLHDESVAARLQAVTPLTLTEDWSHPARHCPPSGVIPFTEFAFYVMPITYVRSEVEHVYYTFREMYISYFQFLHTVNSHPHGLIAQCATFESLMNVVAPDIMKHLTEIQIDPLRFAYRWIMTAFSGFLPVQELLQLWDRILGFDDMRLLAITSVGIFMSKEVRLMQSRTSNAVKKILKNLSDVRVLDLLQGVLFNNEIDCTYDDWRQKQGYEPSPAV